MLLPFREYLRLTYYSKKCGIIFRRIDGASDQIQPPTRIIPFEPDLPSQFQPRLALLQTMPEAVKDIITDFKRVRLHLQSNYLNEAMEKLKTIKFTDAVGRKFSFPSHLCHQWLGMSELVMQLFAHHNILGALVRGGRYDLMSIHGELFLPQYWEARIRPGMSITMHMWPMPTPMDVWPMSIGDISNRPPDVDDVDLHMFSPMSLFKRTQKSQRMERLHRRRR